MNKIRAESKATCNSHREKERKEKVMLIYELKCANLLQIKDRSEEDMEMV